MTSILLVLLACNDMSVGDTDCFTTDVDDGSWSRASLAELRESYAAAGPTALDWNVDNAVGAGTESVTFDPVAFLSEEADICTTEGASPQLITLSAPVSVDLEGADWIPATAADGLLLIDANGVAGLSVGVPIPVPAALAEAAAALLGDAMDTEVAAAEVPAEMWLDAMVREDGVTATLMFAREQTVLFADGEQPEPVGVEVVLANTEH